MQDKQRISDRFWGCSLFEQRSKRHKPADAAVWTKTAPEQLWVHAQRRRKPAPGSINRLLTAAICGEVLLQGGNVSVPAQSVDVLRVGGSGKEPKGSQVDLGGAETRQVAAWGEVVVQGRGERSLLVNLQQEAKLKGCRNKRADVRRVTRRAASGREVSKAHHSHLLLLIFYFQAARLSFSL